MKQFILSAAMSLVIASVFVSAVNLNLGVQWRTGNVLPGQVTALVKGDPDRDGQPNFFAAVLSGNIVNIFGFEFTMNDLPVIVWKSAPMVMDGGIKAMVIGDYDGDGSRELSAIGNHQNDLKLYVYEHSGAVGVDRYNSVSPFQSQPQQDPNTITNGGSPVGVAITDANHNGKMELMIASNLVAGGAIGVYEAAPGGSNIVAPIPQGIQPIIQPMQAFTAGDADGDYVGVPDQAVYTYRPPSPTPAALIVYTIKWPQIGSAVTIPINVGTGSGTEVAVFDADASSGWEIAVANRQDKNTFLSFIKYMRGAYSVLATYQLPVRYRSVTSIKTPAGGASSFQTSNQPVTLGLSDDGGFLVTTYDDLRGNIVPYVVAPVGYPTINAVPAEDADNDGLADFLVAVNNEVLFYEDKTLIYLTSASNPRAGGTMRYKVRNAVPNAAGHCFLSFATTANCQRYPNVEGCDLLSHDILFYWVFTGDPRIFQNFIFSTNSRGESIGDIIFNVPNFPPIGPPWPQQIPIYNQCITQQGLQIKLTNIQEAILNIR